MRKSLRGGVSSGAVWGESVLVGGLKGCYWWKTVWHTRELHYYIRTENINQLTVACSECTLASTVGVEIMFYIESHWIHHNTWKTFVCCLLSGCGINAFRMASSNSSPAEKSCACAYVTFWAGIFSWYADSTANVYRISGFGNAALLYVTTVVLPPQAPTHWSTVS
jgi:hypothetical protein